MKIASFYGTRPQVIKASRLGNSLRSCGKVLTVDTGQHYDWLLNGVLYRELGIVPPDHFLEIGSGEHSDQTARLLIKCSAVIKDFRPDVTVVIGDTNSTLGAALASAQLRVPVVHVEAGLRSGVATMAEELNRRLVDTLSALLCAPSERAASILHGERVLGRVEFTGDIARDVLLANLARAHLPDFIEPIKRENGFILATLHRAELTESSEALVRVLEALDQLRLPVILPTHPRTSRAIERTGFVARGSLRLIQPLGYLDAIACVRAATVVITDSGGIQREAYWLGIPCVTVRSETEWLETLEVGANRLVSPESAGTDLARAIEAALEAAPWNRDVYGTGHAADAIVSAVRTMS